MKGIAAEKAEKDGAEKESLLQKNQLVKNLRWSDNHTGNLRCSKLKQCFFRRLKLLISKLDLEVPNRNSDFNNRCKYNKLNV